MNRDYEALVIDDDLKTIDEVEDTLASLGHTFHSAVSQEDARKCIKIKLYSYILLALEIPARSRHGVRRIQNGVNLLDEIRAVDGYENVPVIIMNAHVAVNAELTVKMMRLAAAMIRKGPVDFIYKPLPSVGRTLDKLIRKALRSASRTRTRSNNVASLPSLNPKKVVQPDVTEALDKSDDEPAVVESAQSGFKLLTKSQRDILETLMKNPQRAMLQVDIVEVGGYSKHVTQECLKRLRTLGLVHRPHGNRKGDAITLKGKDFLEPA